MKNTLKIAALALGLCIAGAVVRHAGSPSDGALLAGAGSAAGTHESSWATEGFRDAESCTLLSDPPECR